jgi:ankyrin repeat/BTB/POZ domain-containing protein 2
MVQISNRCGLGFSFFSACSAIAVAAAHGQRAVLHKLLSHPVNGNSNAEVLSLEEILAEGASHLTSDRRPARSQVIFGFKTSRILARQFKIIFLFLKQASGSSSSSDSSRSANNNASGNDNKLQVVKLNKGQIKALQEAMYHSAENAHLDITLDLRNLGVPWTLHCWMHTLATAHEHSLENVIDQLLQDFLQVWGPDDYSTQFVDECLPIIFNIFRYSKVYVVKRKNCFRK